MRRKIATLHVKEILESRASDDVIKDGGIDSCKRCSTKGRRSAQVHRRKSIVLQSCSGEASAKIIEELHVGEGALDEFGTYLYRLVDACERQASPDLILG